MSAGVLTISAHIRSTSGLPRDDAVNNYHFSCDSAAAAENAALAAGWVHDDVYGSSPNIASSFSNTRATTMDLFAYFTDDLTGRTPTGPPILHTTPFTGGASTTTLPLECAICLSYHGDMTGLSEEVGLTRPAARHRGRIYLGPWGVSALNSGAGGPSVASAILGQIVAAGAALKARRFPLDSGGWCVWSKANANLYQVVGGFVDDEFDTRRSRQRRALARTSF